MKFEQSARVCAIVFSLALARNASAQKAATPTPVGVWRGTSLCLVRPSACHDEVVVYRITRLSTDSVSLDARKIVNGKEEEMGVLPCRVAAAGAQVTCKIPRGTWLFSVRGDSLTGELMLPDGKKFRDVRMARSR
jgi:hypothetical protein